MYLQNVLKLWLSCETLTVSFPFNPVPIKWGSWSKKGGVKNLAHFRKVLGESSINAIEGKNLKKMQFDPPPPTIS